MPVHETWLRLVHEEQCMGEEPVLMVLSHFTQDAGESRM